jgi:hypothetical protein
MTITKAYEGLYDVTQGDDLLAIIASTANGYELRAGGKVLYSAKTLRSCKAAASRLFA